MHTFSHMWNLGDKKGVGTTVRKDEGDPDEIAEITKGNGGKYKQRLLHVYIICYSPVTFTVS